MTRTVAVTGLNATDNPAPGVAVIRALRAADPDLRIIGLSYDALDPGNYMAGIADHVYLVPYPSAGADVLLNRLLAIHAANPIDVVVPCLDSELAAYMALAPHLRQVGIRTCLPTPEAFDARAKDQLHRLADVHGGVRVPKSIAVTDPAKLWTLDIAFDFPVVVKGRFYDAAVCHTAAEAVAQYHRLAAAWGLPVIVQQFVDGTEFDVACVGDGRGGLVGSVPMRKMQLTDKGKAWGGITVHDPALDVFAEDVMAALRWNGPCELEIMRERDSGDLYLIEVNPRLPAWIYLSVGADRNLPWAVVQTALGYDVEPMPPAPPGVMFLRHSCDQILSLEAYEALTIRGELHDGVAATTTASIAATMATYLTMETP